MWKLFSDRYSHKAGRRICIEVAQSCPQCQIGSNYGHRLKTMGSIQSKGPWDTLSVDIVGPLPADRRHEFIIVFVDCFSRYSILVPASNHTASTVRDALLRHVVPYFDTPHRLLSDRGREFVGEVWTKLTHSLGIQRLLTSSYHPEGNSINERSHRTINNMLRSRLLEGVPSRTWVDKIPGIMLALNTMVHEPHGFSASMIATGREPTLPPDLEGDACASPALDDPASYVEAVKKRLTLTHQQMTPPPAPVATNPYREGSLIFAMTTPPERSNKLAPRWKGPFLVKRVLNPYQVTYEDGLVWRTIHVNHAKPAKTPADGFPAPLHIPEPPKPTLGCIPRSLQRPLSQRPLPPPQPAAPTAGPPQPAAAPPTATPPSSRTATRSVANRNSAPRAGHQPPTAPGRANENSRLGQLCMPDPQGLRYKKPPSASRSSVTHRPQDGQDLPSLSQIWTVPGAPGRPLRLFQPLPGRPPQWEERIPDPYPATHRCPTEVAGPNLTLCIEGPSHPTRTSAPATFPARRIVVAPAVRWGLPPGIQRPSLLSGTPGTACGLARG